MSLGCKVHRLFGQKSGRILFWKGTGGLRSAAHPNFSAPEAEHEGVSRGTFVVVVVAVVVVAAAAAPEPIYCVGCRVLPHEHLSCWYGFQDVGQVGPSTCLEASELRRLTGNGQNFCGWDEPLSGICWMWGSEVSLLLRSHGLSILFKVS